MSIEQAIVDKVRSLSPDKQQEILDFAEFLVQKTQTTATPTKTDWRNSPAVGMWEDREEMQDSTGWVQNLCQQEWNKS